MRLLSFTLAILLLFAASTPAVTYYRWVDEKGVVHISENKPQGVEAEKIVHEDRPQDLTGPNFSSPEDVPENPQSGKSTGMQSRALIGTGFFINDSGYIVTNRHLTHNCSKIMAKLADAVMPLSLVSEDDSNDLALLRAEGKHSVGIVFRQGQEIRPGESILVLGFPLYGLLADDVNVAAGIVSALAGMGNDKRYVQIAAPVQQGNSGGPLLDQSGNLVGTVVGKLDALKIARVTGDIPQNINFAIKSEMVESFLKGCGVPYQKSLSDKALPVSTIFEQARRSIVLLECLR